MNSSQRRQEKRKFKHVVTLSSLGKNNERNRYWEAVDWCVERFGTEGTRWRDRYRSDREFKFASEKDAIIFAITWV